MRACRLALPGHGRFDALGTLGISAFLVAGGAGISSNAYFSVVELMGPTAAATAEASASFSVPTAVALGVAAASIIVKELFFHWTHAVGTRIGSSVGGSISRSHGV
jgi:divalent metal cation (Fe/Co/Zn/Cd) transporter